MERHSHGLEFELGLGGSSRPRELRAAPWDVLYKTEYLPHGPPLMIPQRRSRGRGSQGLPRSTSATKATRGSSSLRSAIHDHWKNHSLK